MKIEKIEQNKDRKASFRLTRRCNNNCPHCYINLPLKAKTEEFSAKNWEKIIDSLVENNFSTLSLTGGEITIYPDFKKVYVYAKKKGLAVALLTNATCFDEKTINILWKYPPAAVTVTLYGFDAATYALVTGNKEGWQKFSKNMDFLMKLKREKGTKLNVISIRTKDTIKFLKEIDELGERYIGEKPFYANSLFSRLDENYARNIKIEEKKVTREELKTVLFRNEKQENFCLAAKVEPKNKTNSELFACQAGKRDNIYFFEEGTMTFCSLIGQEQYTVKLKQEDIENFDYKKEKRKLYEKFSPLLKLKINEKCAGCELRSQCDSCPAKNLLKGILITGYDEEVCLKK